MRRLSVLLLTMVSLHLAVGNDVPQPAGVSRGAYTDELLPPGQAPNEVLAQRWSAQISQRELIGTPVSGAGMLYAGTLEGTVVGMDPGSGNVVWSYDTGGSMAASPVWFKGRIYAASQDGIIHVLRAGTGEPLTNGIYHGTTSSSTPLIVEDVAYGTGVRDMLILALGFPAMEIRSYDAWSGELLWTGSPGLMQVSNSSPAYHAEMNRVIVGDNSGIWYSYDASTGEKKWSYRPHPFPALYNSAACLGGFVALPAAGGSREVHIVKETNTAPYYTLFKKVNAIPPATTAEGAVEKSGGTSSGQPDPVAPTRKVSGDELDLLIQMAKAERDAHLAQLGIDKGVSMDDLGEWLDHYTKDVDGNLNKASQQTGISYVDLSVEIQTSSTSFVPGGPNGELPGVLVTHREAADDGNDAFYTTFIQLDETSAAETKVVWGTFVKNSQVTDHDRVAAPSVSQWSWVYAVRGQYLEVRNYADGAKEGSIDVGTGILGGPVLSNGRVYITTQDGRLICYDSANAPPGQPTGMSPSGGGNITTTSTPTLQWNAVDPDGDPLSSRIWYGVGLADAELDLWETTPVELPAGVSSYTLPSQAENSKLFYRVEVGDDKGARAISGVKTFWVNRDLDPPLPVADMTTTPYDGMVLVEWLASPSPDVTGYRLSVKPSTQGGWTGAVVLDDLSGGSYMMSSLSNGVEYDFKLEAKDAGENYSTPEIRSEMPMAPVTINGVPYASVQAALNAASPGDTVVLGASTNPFVGNLVVPPGVSLKGHSPHHTRIVGTGTGAVVSVQGDVGQGTQMVEISNLSVTYGTTGIEAGTADLNLHHTVIYQINGDGLTAGFGGRLDAENNTICHNVGRGISVMTEPAEARIHNNLVGENGGGVYVEAGSIIDYNQAWGNAPEENYGAGLAGQENGTEASLFTDIGAGDYTVLAGSAAIDGGDPEDSYAMEPVPNGDIRNLGAYGDTIWAANTALEPEGGIGNAPPSGGGGGGGGCGAMGLDFLVMLGLLRLALGRIRRG